MSLAIALGLVYILYYKLEILIYFKKDHKIYEVEKEMDSTYKINFNIFFYGQLATYTLLLLL